MARSGFRDIDKLRYAEPWTVSTAIEGRVAACGAGRWFRVTPSYDFDPLVGVGVGVALLSGWMRLDLAKGVHPSTSVRFDLLFRVPL